MKDESMVSTTMHAHQCTPQFEFGQNIWKQTRGKLNPICITSNPSRVMLMKITSRGFEPQLHVGDMPFAVKFLTFHIN